MTQPNHSLLSLGPSPPLDSPEPQPPPRPPDREDPEEIVIDTGSTGHFFPVRSPHIKNKRLALRPIRVRMPDESVIQNTHEGELDIPRLPKRARIAQLFEQLGDTCLLSMGLLCDVGCRAVFTDTEVDIIYQDHVILHGVRNASTNGLWLLEIPEKVERCNAIQHSASAAEMVAFAHASMWSPVLSTLQKALDEDTLSAIPGLTAESLRRHPPLSEATIKGHMDALRKNQRSTKTDPQERLKEEEKYLEELFDCMFPEPIKDGKRTHHVFLACIPIEGQLHTDLTGRLPNASRNGNNYILFAYHYDANAVLFHPVKNRKGPTLLNAYKVIQKRLEASGCRPILHRLDNECSQALKDFMNSKHETFQFVPAGDHRRNASKRAT